MDTGRIAQRAGQFPVSGILPDNFGDGNNLYFISARPYGPDPVLAWVSYRNPHGWLEPSPLVGFVNQYWEEYPSISEGAPASLALDSSGTTMLYCKYELFMWYDPEVCSYLSYLITDVNNDDITLPTDIILTACPSPFNTRTTLTVQGLNEAIVDIYDLSGRQVAHLQTQHGQAIWDAIDLSSGLYFARVVTEGNSPGVKIVLLK